MGGSQSTPKFKVGDTVRVSKNVSTVRELQKGHGGWNDDMEKCLGKVGTVKHINASGDILILISGQIWVFNPLCLTLAPGLTPDGGGGGGGEATVDGLDLLKLLLVAAASTGSAEKPTRKFNTGDMVRVLDDADVVQQLQKGHGGWIEGMSKSIGQTGKVLSVDSDGDVKIAVRGGTWTFNPLCLAPANKDPSTRGSTLSDMAKLKAMVLLSSAVSGDAEEVRKVLQTNPELVNVQISNKSALHCAVAANSLSVVKVILEFKPHLELKDEDGDTALHLTAQRDTEEIVEILLTAGANVNAKNNKGITPLMIAVAKGHQKVTKLLVKRPNIDPQQQDTDGDTALHYAVAREKVECLSILLEAGANPTTRNEKGFTPMHEAAKRGFASVIGLFIKLTPQYINNKKDDGYTMLHLAALNGNIYVVNTLAASEHCDLDVKNAREQTALHVALVAKEPVIAEQLVGYGADINAVDKDGDTPLHYAFVLPNVPVPSKDTPQLLKVRDKLQSQSKLPSDEQTASRIIWASFVVQEGGNTEIKNKKQRSAIQLCPNENADAIIQFKGTKGSFHGCLRPKKTNNSAIERALSLKNEGDSCDFELKEKLGEGGQGAVYKAVLKSNGKLIAVKKVNLASVATAEKELSTLQGVKHKNIVHFFGVAKDPDGGILILMELAENSLYHAVKKLPPDTRRSINWATQVAQGMRYLHYDAPDTILHGDLKSLNVLSFPDDVVKISDFGCAKVFSVTHATSTAISILWSAPELFDKTQKPNLACDVYSFGILLWEMVTHKVPYDGMGIEGILTQVIKGNKRPDIPSSCPEFLSTLMKQCWESNPKNRPTFKAILQILEDEKIMPPTNNSKPKACEEESTNDFELMETIGHGATGTVWKAAWKSKNIMVAVKRISGKISANTQRELAIMKSLRHKNIIHFHGYYQDPDQNCLIIFELAQNSLDQIFPTCSPDTKRSLNWAKQVARGMCYLHYDAPETILHGDLKSMNVLTFPNDVVKVTDFGSAKYFDHTTVSSTVRCTYAWTAPELFMPGANPDLAGDVFSYGIVLWEMVTHMKPFSDCNNPQQITYSITNGRRPTIPNNCPDILNNLMTKCWDGNPSLRPNFKVVVRTLEEAGEKEFF